MRNITALVMQLFIFSIVFASNIDSLETDLSKAANSLERFEILMNLGNEISNSNPDSGLYYLQKVIVESDSILVGLKSSPNKEEIENINVRALIKVSVILRLQAKYKNALNYLRKALLIVKSSGNKEKEEEIYEVMGIIYRQQGEYKYALEYELNALEIAKILKDSSSIASLFNNLGVVYMGMNNYKEALNCFSNALEIVEKTKVYAPNVELLNIGNIYKIQEDYSKALQYVNRALSISEQKEDKQRIAECYFTLGDIFLMQDSNKLSRRYFVDALNIFSELNYNYGSDECYSKIGESYKKDNKLKEALKNYEKALEIAERQNDKETQSYILLEIADLYLSLEDIGLAEKYAKKSLIIASKMHFINIINGAYKILSKSFEYKGDYKKSLFYLNKYIETKDSIFTEEKYKAVLETEAKYLNLKKDMELSLLQKEKDIFKEKAKKNRILNITIGIISLLLLILLLLGYFYSKQKEKAIRIKSEKEKTQMILEYDKKLMEFRLITLKNQLNPHFIFNTLNSIGSVILKSEKQKAYDLFTNFTSLVRHTIENSDNISISLKEELEQIKKYLYLQKFRFKDKFDYFIKIDDNVDLSIPVPRMFAEIFVENAIKHGLKHKETGGKLTINISQQENRIKIIIIDNGVGREKAKNISNFSTGKGIKIAQEMFNLYEQLHENKVSFEIIDLYDKNGDSIGTKIVEKIIIN